MGSPKIYTEHPGTIRISGTTVPREAGQCAICSLEAGKKVIEFLCIGANANQQATKSMGVFLMLFERNSCNSGKSLAFQPLEFLTYVRDRSTGQQVQRTATVWRTVMFSTVP